MNGMNTARQLKARMIRRNHRLRTWQASVGIRAKEIDTSAIGSAYPRVLGTVKKCAGDPLREIIDAQPAA